MPLNDPITPALLADPEIFQQNRLPPHAYFADQTSPLLGGPLTVSLDGAWDFRPPLRHTPLCQHPVPVGRPRKTAPRADSAGV